NDVFTNRGLITSPAGSHHGPGRLAPWRRRHTVHYGRHNDRHVGRSSPVGTHRRSLGTSIRLLHLGSHDRGLDGADGVVTLAISVRTLAADSSHSLIRPSIGCTETETRHRRLDKRVIRMDSKRPPHNGSDDTRNSSKKNLAARKPEPVRENHPCGQIHRPGSNRCPEVHEIALETPDLNRPRNRAENDPRDRTAKQSRISNFSIVQIFLHGVYLTWKSPLQLIEDYFRSAHFEPSKLDTQHLGW